MMMLLDALRRVSRRAASTASRAALAGVVVALLTLGSCATASRGFESGTFAGWYQEFPSRDSAQVVRDPVREGEFAAWFEVSPDARSITGGLRSEVSELWYKAPFGVEHWYRFSTLIPEDTAAPTFRCVIAQWHAWPDILRGEAWRSPVIAIEYRLDQFIIRICHNAEALQTDNSPLSNNKRVLYTSGEHGARDVWHDFIVRALFDPFGDGHLSVWIDGDQVVDYDGPLGYNDRRGPWFKMGIYRDRSPAPFTIYHDAYRRGRTPASVDAPPP